MRLTYDEWQAFEDGQMRARAANKERIDRINESPYKADTMLLDGELIRATAFDTLLEKIGRADREVNCGHACVNHAAGG